MSSVQAAVKALIQNKDGKFLLLEQELDGTTYIDLPGGKVEYGESPYDTLLREVKEEVGLTVTIGAPLGMWWFFRKKDGVQIVCNTFLCAARTTDVDLSQNPGEENITRYAWLSKQGLIETPGECHESLREVFREL